MSKQKNLWWEFLHPIKHLCGLCGNRGIIDTVGKVQSNAGVSCGIRAFCICPNGRAMKRHKALLNPQILGEEAIDSMIV